MVPGHILRNKVMDQVGGLGWGIGTLSLGLELLAEDPRSHEVQSIPPNQNFSLCNQCSWGILKRVKSSHTALGMKQQGLSAFGFVSAQQILGKYLLCARG